MNDARPLQQLVEDLWDRDARVRQGAIEALAASGAAAVPLLMQALKSEVKHAENPALRRAMIQVGEPAFEALLADLQPRNRSIGMAAQALAAWGDPRAVEPLIESMLHRHVSRQGKLAVIDALGAFGDPRAFKALVRALLDPHPAVRVQAAWALAEYGDPSVVPLVTHALSEPDDQRLREELPRVLARLQEAQRQREAGARSSHAQALAQAEAACFSDAAAAYAAAYYERGQLRARLKNYVQAIQDYQRALKLNPAQAQVYHSRGLAYARLQNHAQAIADYDQALELNPGEAQVYHSRGLAQAELQNYAQAIADYDRAIELQESAMTYHHRGLAHARLQNYTRAVQDLKRAIELSKFAQVHYYNLARVYVLMGESKRAYKWLETVIELDRGYGRLAWSDEDFKGLRKDARFKKLVGMDEYYEIIPGASVGPFRLGMARQEAQQVIKLERARGIRFQLEDASATSNAAGSPAPGVYLHYDVTGNCCKIDAIFGYVPAPPVFTLAGRIVNGMTDDEAASILRSMATSVKPSYAALSSAAGLRTVKWEASDEHIMSIVVSPKAQT